MNQISERYAGYDCVKLENTAVSVWVTRDVGPRIIGLALPDGDNLLAVVPQASATTPAGNVYQLRGGHRLWHAPEHIERTYVPDDTAVTINNIPNGIQTVQDVEASTGIEKRMAITLPDDAAKIVIEHTLTNRGLWPIELAPWAITQLKPGGFAILPQADRATGLLPSRRMAFWPYTRLNSPHLQLSDRYVFFHATIEGDEAFKIGWDNWDGWLAYWVDNTLFIKEAAYQKDAEYYDFGSSSECYSDYRFLELETLGPRTTLAPDASVSHQEVWRLFPNVSLQAEETAVAEVMAQLLI